MGRTFKSCLSLAIIGVIFIIGGLIVTRMGNDRLERDSVPAEATVVDYVEDSEMRGKIWVDVYYPVVSYEADGQEYKIQYSKSDDEKLYEIGQEVTVKYSPEDPTEFVIAEDTDSTHFSGTWAVALGVVILIAALVWLVVAKIKAGRRS